MSGTPPVAPESDSTAGLVLFLGMVRRGEFESLLERGLPLGVLVDSNAKQRLGDVSRFALVERFDFSRPFPELLDAVRSIQRRHGLACLFNVIEFYVAPTAAVAAALGLPALSTESARLCLDKSLMRARFLERIGPAAAARFHVVRSEPELLRSADELGYPVFLQPANVSASMWSTKHAAPGSLLASYRALVDEVPKYYQRLGQRHKSLVVVLAEHLEGRNTSIDCLIDRAGRVFNTPAVDVLTGVDVGIDDYHHFARLLPSRLDARRRRELDELAMRGVESIEMTSCAAHVEFIGSRLGEIGARPGGNRPRILEMAYGMDLLNAYREILLGRSPDLRRTRERAAAIVTPFAPKNGKLREIRHLDRIPKLSGYLYHEIRAQTGQAVGLARDGYRAPLYVELASESEDDVRRGVDEIASWSDLFAVE